MLHDVLFVRWDNLRSNINLICMFYQPELPVLWDIEVFRPNHDLQRVLAQCNVPARSSSSTLRTAMKASRKDWLLFMVLFVDKWESVTDSFLCRRGKCYERISLRWIDLDWGWVGTWKIVISLISVDWKGLSWWILTDDWRFTVLDWSQSWTLVLWFGR